MDEKSQQLLDKYIGKLLELKDAKNNQFSEAELKEIALEIGLTESDLKMAKQEVQSHIKRGKSYAKTANWNKAEQEFKHASELDPVNIHTQYELASYYYLHWSKTGKQKSELDQAIQACLALDPENRSSTDLLQKINRSYKRKRTVRRIKRVALGIFIPITLLVIVFILVENEVITPSPTGLEGMEYNIPVEVASVDNMEGVKLTMEKFSIKHDESVTRQESFDFEYIGNITSEIYEVHKLRYKMEFLDAQNNVLADEYLWLFNANTDYAGDEDRFILHPKDYHIFSGGDFGYFDGKIAKVTKIVLHADNVERFRPPVSYPAYEVKDLIWNVQKVNYLDFELKERQNTYVNDDYGRPRHYLGYELTHNGTNECRELILLIEWLDARGQVVRDEEITVISLKHQPVEPGKKLIFSETFYFDENQPRNIKPFDSYRVSVKTAD